MSKYLAETDWAALEYFMPGSMLLGTALGSVGGIIIGGGVSLTSGLFYSSSGILIFAVITLSALLGALFGHLMGSMLSQNIAFMEHSAGVFQSDVLPAAYSTAALEKKVEESIKKEYIMLPDGMRGALPKMPQRYHEMTIPYHSDIRIFEMIVATAHRIQVENRR